MPHLLRESIVAIFWLLGHPLLPPRPLLVEYNSCILFRSSGTFSSLQHRSFDTMAEGVGRFLHGQLIWKASLPTQDLTGQTIIVTGANSGLGFVAAGHFARLNAARVILACRNLAKGEEARQKILAETAREPRAVEVWQLDMASYDSVLAFGQRVNAQLDRLDAVLANAGVHVIEFRTVESMEENLAINVVTQVLLGLLVLPKLRESASKHGIRPRLTVVGSAVHYWTKFSEKKAIKVAGGKMEVLEALNDKTVANMPDRYYLSKLLVLMVWQEMAAQMGQTKVIVNVVEPGLCQSNLFREDGVLDGFMPRMMMRLLARSTDQGARVLVNATLSGEETHGKYMANYDLRV